MRSLHHYRSILTFVVLWATIFPFTVAENATKCYAPNGLEATYSNMGTGTDLFLYACPPGDDGFATCCVGTDFCQPNNLCYNLNNGAPVAYRQYCTDPTWESDNCSGLCRTAGEKNANTSGAVGLSPCGDGKFCCGWFNTDCCENHEGTYAVQGFQVGLGNTVVATATAQGTTTASVSGLQSTISSSQTSSLPLDTSTSSSPNSDSKSTSLNTGTIAGIAVGAAGVGAIFALSGMIFLRRHNSAPTKEDPAPATHSENYPSDWGHQQSYQPQQYADTTKPNEVYAYEAGDGRIPTPEMNGIPMRYELNGK